MKKLLISLCISLFCATLLAQDYQFARDIAYRPNTPEGQPPPAMCKLDIAYPQGSSQAPTLVWFHGGGLTGGHREIPRELLANHLIVVGVEYRLSPEATTDEIIDDAAAAVAWVMDHIGTYGGNPKRIYLAGHSAGGYLVNMVGLDKSRLEKYGKDANQLAAIIPYSGHAITHYNTRKLMGLAPHQALIDSTAPIRYVRADAPPLLIISGDREKELYGRYEETAYFWRMLKLAGHPDVTLYELDGFDHGSMATPAHALTLKLIREREKKK